MDKERLGSTHVFALIPWLRLTGQLLRASLVEIIPETLGLCLASTLKDMLGLAACESVYGLLERNGFPRREICNRFDDTVTVLTRAFGRIVLGARPSNRC